MQRESQQNEKTDENSSLKTEGREALQGRILRPKRSNSPEISVPVDNRNIL